MYKKDTLQNGIRVVSEIIPHVRSVSLGIWVNVGARDESPGQGGISHFIEHMLFKGTKKRSARDIAIEMDSMGGELNAFTSKEGTTYYVKVLDEHLPKAVELLSDIFHNSVFDEKEIERERKVIVEEIKMVEDTPDDLVHEMFYETVWKGSPLGRPVLGTKKSVRSVTRDDFVSFMKRRYTPSEIVISAAGKFDRDRLLEMLEARFGGRKGRRDNSKKEPASFTAGVNVQARKLEQTHICLGVEALPYSHPDRFGMYALNTVIGSSMSSRLFQEIRERHALAYSVYSYLTSLKDTGLFVVYAGVSPSRAPQVVRLILKELKKVKSAGIGADELKKVKDQMKGNMVLGMENTYNRMSQLAKQEMYLGRRYTLDDMLEQVERVDMALVDRLFGEAFIGRPMAMTALGPVDKHALVAEMQEL